MNKLFSNCWRFSPLLSLVIFIGLVGAQLSGCAAGGTSGTGVKSFNGRVIAQNDQAIADVLVTLLGTDISSVTDETGSFAMEAELDESEATFTFERRDLNTAYTITNLPMGDSVVTVTFRIDQSTQVVKAEDVQISTPTSSSTAASSSIAAVSDNPTSTPPLASAGSESSPSSAAGASSPSSASSQSAASSTSATARSQSVSSTGSDSTGSSSSSGSFSSGCAPVTDCASPGSSSSNGEQGPRSRSSSSTPASDDNPP